MHNGCLGLVSVVLYISLAYPKNLLGNLLSFSPLSPTIIRSNTIPLQSGWVAVLVHLVASQRRAAWSNLGIARHCKPSFGTLNQLQDHQATSFFRLTLFVDRTPNQLRLSGDCLA